MREIFFLFSIDDTSLPQVAISLGYNLVLNVDYNFFDDILFIQDVDGIDKSLRKRFNVVPDTAKISDFAVGEGKKKDGSNFRYIRDRIGAASIDLNLYSWPSIGNISVGSLSFHETTYTTTDGKLDPLPRAYLDIYRNLHSFVKRSSYVARNSRYPKTVYVFPKSLSILREDILRSPWPSINID